MYLFLEREGKGGRRRGDKHVCVRETLVCCLLNTPNWGPGPQPRHVPGLGIELATLWLALRQALSPLSHTGQDEVSDQSLGVADGAIS